MNGIHDIKPIYQEFNVIWFKNGTPKIGKNLKIQDFN